MNKIEPYITILVPLTLIVSYVSYLIGGFLSLDALQTNIKLLISALAYALAVGSFNILNNLCDIKADTISKPYRPLPSLRMTIQEAWIYYILLTFMSLLIAFFIDYSVVFVIVIVSVLSWIYSFSPVRLKEVLHLNTAIVSIMYSLLPLVSGWLLFSPLTAVPWNIVIVITLVAYFLVITKDINDVIADEVTNVKTIPVVFGIKKTGFVLKRVLVFPYALLLLFVWIGWLGYAYLIAILPLFPAYYLASYIEKKPDKKIGERVLAYAMILGITTEILILVAGLIS